MTIRAFGPWLNVSTLITGVPKSCTSRRRSRLRGSEVFAKSTISVRPCWRMSMPVEASERSTTIRPRRCGRGGSRRRAARAARRPGRASAKRCTICCLASSCSDWSYSVTSTLLPSTCVSKVAGLLRLNTTRVRLPAWMTLRLRSDGVVDRALVAAEPVAGVEEVEGDPRRARDREAGGRIRRRRLQRELDDGVPGRAPGHRHRVDAVGPLGEGRSRGRHRDRGKQPRDAAGHPRPQRDGVKPDERAHLFRSCRFASPCWSSSVLDRSVQSPAPSWTSSLSLISLSATPITTP